MAADEEKLNFALELTGFQDGSPIYFCWNEGIIISKLVHKETGKESGCAIIHPEFNKPLHVRETPVEILKAAGYDIRRAVPVVRN